MGTYNLMREKLYINIKQNVFKSLSFIKVVNILLNLNRSHVFLSEFSLLSEASDSYNGPKLDELCSIKYYYNNYIIF